MMKTSSTENITINVRLYAVLRDLARGRVQNPASLSLPSTALVADILPALSIPEMEVVYSVNGQVVDEQAALHDGDSVTLFPAISGGQWQ